MYQVRDGLYLWQAPMIGTFHRLPETHVGQELLPDTNLCRFSGGHFNEIATAEVAGCIEEICVETDTLVEYGQVLFKIRTKPISPTFDAVIKKE